MKIVIDTNDFISALIGKKHRDKLYLILSDPNIEVIADNT
jgi:predicted nucleic acid-binding protein